MQRKLRRTGTLAAVVALAWMAQGAGAQDYPSRPIRIVVPFAPGGGADFVTRSVATPLAQALRQSIVVDNRAGGGGTIGTEVVTSAVPDGYTLVEASATTLAVLPILTKVSYDPVRDLAPITVMGAQTHMVAVHPSLPVKSVKELVALAKGRPGAMNYASSGNGGPNHLGTELFKLAAGIDMIHIPYKGNGPALVDLVAGQVQMGLMTMATTMPFVRSGRLRALAVTSPKRSNVTPDLPTVAELGFPGFEVRSWYGLLAPARTPVPIINKLQQEIAGVLRRQDVLDRFAGDGVEPGGNTPEEFAAFIAAEMKRWGTVVKAAKIRLD
jgi:tripartite-type tricarboxylate transporter receptor subunit TctC